jgi:hypothetical protein
MIFQDKKPLNQQKVPAGELLSLQGSPCNTLNIVHSGQVEVLSCVKNQYTIPPDEILQQSRKVYTAGSNSIPGALSLLEGKPYMNSYRTLSECVISTFPATKETLPKILASRLSIGMLIQRSLLTELSENYKMTKEMAGLNEYLSRFSDNLALAYSFYNPQVFESLDTDEQPGAAPGTNMDPVLPAAKVLVAAFREKGGAFPTPFTEQFLENDHGQILNQQYKAPFEFDMEQFNFYRRMLKVPAKVQAALYQSDIQILMYLLASVGKMVHQIQTISFQYFNQLMELCSNLADGPFCWLEKYTVTAQLSADGFGQFQPSEFSPVASSLLQTTRNMQSRLRKIFAWEMPTCGKQDELSSLLQSKADEQETEEEPEVTVTEDSGGALDELKDSAKKIMNFVNWDVDKQKELVELLTQLKNTKAPLDSDSDKRKLRRQIAGPYWEIYTACVAKWVQGGRNRLPLPVDLMLHYGFFDDRQLNEQSLVELSRCMDRTKSPYPIMMAHEFLGEIHDKKRPPSISELGQSYVDVLRDKHNQPKWRKETDLPADVDTNLNRLEFEIGQEMATTTRLTSGSPVTHFPVLIQDHLIYDIDKMWVTREKLGQQVHDLLEIDYSMFFREVLVNDEAAGIYKEFVQTEVLPNFIIVPSVGSKMMSWQIFEGRSKQSQGRVMVPAFHTEDLFSMLVDSMGAFVWELCKEIQGPDWNNVSVSSITADYMDYLQFYRKNRDLSLELKEKIHTEMKKFRTDRDKFVNDYQKWIKHESKGILKLNKVTRNIFYRHVPFTKAIRDELKSQPAFGEIANRFANIRNRKKKELETRYKKYTRDGAKLPRLLQENLDFYSI